MSEQEWKDVSNGNAVDIKKEQDKAHTGTYKGRTEIETKIGKQTIWQFLDDDGIPFGVYGFTMLNRVMENIPTGTDCKLTYTGTKNVKTKFGMKDVHQVRVQIRPGAESGDMMAPEEAAEVA